MNNYEYIVASLPVISQDTRSSDGGPDFTSLVEWIRSQCSASDNRLIDFLLQGYDDEGLNAAFYSKALSHKDEFLRQYFTLDLAIRNAKVRHINKALGRPLEQDIFMPSPDESPLYDEVMAGEDILERERKIDDLLWKRIDEVNVFKYFEMDRVLGFIAQLHIIDRWMKLDPETGKEMFRSLVSGVRGSFSGIQYEEKK